MASSKQERDKAQEACKLVTDFLDTESENPIVKGHAYIIIAVSEHGFQHAVDDRIDAEMQITIFSEYLKHLQN